jgi:hypothetical protein
VFLVFSFLVATLAEPYHCKGKFFDDFDALCRQAQITYIVPVVARPRAPGTPMANASTSDAKEKSSKLNKTQVNKDRDLAAPMHNETESADISAGRFRCRR